MSFLSDPPVDNVVPGTLNTTATGGASCSNLTGPVLVSADDDSSGLSDPVTYEWTCTVAAGTNPGSLKFSADGNGDGPTSFPTATSNSSIVSPVLTFTVGVPNGAPDPILNSAVVGSRDYTAVSPAVEVATGSPVLSIVKSNTPGPAAILRPGDGIQYSMEIENTGTTPATNVSISDVVPAEVDYVSCTGGACSESGGTVTWDIETLNPGDSQTVTFSVITKDDLTVSDTDYTITNQATVDSDQTAPVDSNEVTNQLRVLPSVNKSVSDFDAVVGDTLTYTISVNNPGAAFTADVTDQIPAGATFSGTGTCSPAYVRLGNCHLGLPEHPARRTDHLLLRRDRHRHPGGLDLRPGPSGPLDTDLNPIPSNETETEILAPELAIDKSHTGNFTQGQIGAQYNILVSNVATDPEYGTQGTVTVTDTLPAGLTATAINGPGWNCVLATLPAPAPIPWQQEALPADHADRRRRERRTGPGHQLGNGERRRNPTPVTDDDPTTIDGVNLNINKSHQGNFTQGQTGAEYTIEVSNAGPSDSTGTVTVTDTLPAGLTATAINGPGWNCVLATLTCTRSDSLPPATPTRRSR